MIKIIFVTLAFLLPTLLFADFYKCNGVFTNKPCNQESTPAPKSSPPPKESLKKDTLLHDLTMKSIRYKKEYNITLDISEAGNICLEKTSSIEECRAVTQKLDDKLETRRVQAIEITAKEKEIEKINTPAASQNAEQNTIVIVNQPRIKPRPLLNVEIKGVEPILPKHVEAIPSTKVSEPPQASSGSIVGPH